jgi:hypothetical protein
MYASSKMNIFLKCIVSLLYKCVRAFGRKGVEERERERERERGLKTRESD